MPTTEAKKTKVPKHFHFELLEANPITRAAAGGDGATEEGFHVILSTETPCDTFMGQEILSHAAGAIDMSLARNGLSVYLEHGGYPYRPTPDPALHVGIVENITRTDARRLEGDLFFSSHELAQRTKADFGKTLKFGSIRAFPIRRKVTRDNADPNALDTVTYTRWRPEEFSIVGIPADPNAGIARGAGAEGCYVETEDEIDAPATTSQEEPKMPDTITHAAPAASPAAPAAPGPETTAAAATAAGVSVTRSAGTPPADIVRFCDAHGVPQSRAAEFIEKGYSLDRAKAEIFDERVTRGSLTQPPAEVRVDAIPKKDRQRVSIARALQRAVAAKEGNGTFDGLEAEVSQELARQMPSIYRGIGGHFLPMSLLTPEERYERDLQRASRVRAMGTGVAGGGAELVFDSAGDLIELLTARSLCSAFGAQTLMGLTGPIQFPVETGEPTAYFIGENPANGVTQSQLNFGTRTLSPKEAAAQVLFPRRLMNMAAIDIEGRARIRLISKHSRLWDKMALHGRGTDGEPTGIYNTPGVGTVAFGGTVPTYGKLVDLGGAIADANADSDSMRYMTTPLMAAKLKQILDFGAVAGSRPIWDGTFRDGQVAGYRAGSTNQVSKSLGAGADEHGIVFGDWTALTFGHWGVLEFMVDVVTLAGKGQILVTTNELGDSLVERPEAFAVATAAKIA